MKKWERVMFNAGNLDQESLMVAEKLVKDFAIDIMEIIGSYVKTDRFENLNISDREKVILHFGSLHYGFIESIDGFYKCVPFEVNAESIGMLKRRINSIFDKILLEKEKRENECN
jgi:hypothetical protein